MEILRFIAILAFVTVAFAASLHFILYHTVSRFTTDLAMIVALPAFIFVFSIIYRKK